MSTTNEVEWGKLRLVRFDERSSRMTPIPPRIEIVTWTKSGQSRVAKLSRRDLHELIRDAGDMLVQLDRLDAQRASEQLRREHQQ